MVAAAILLTALTGLISAWLARSQLPAGLRFKADFRAVRADARYSFGLSLLQLSNVLAFQLDRVIVSALASPAAAGTYALCVGLANKTLFGIASLTSFAFPAVASLRAEGRNADVASLLQVLQRVAIISMAAILVPALFLSAPFLSLWLRTALQPGTIELLQLLWVGYAFAAVGAPATHVITGTGTSRLAATFAWITAFTLLGTMTLLVPSYGLIAAGVANLSAMSTAVLIFLLLVRRSLKVKREPQQARFWGGLLAGTVAQALLLIAITPYITNWGRFMLAGGASLAVFIIARLVTNTITDEERRLIHSVALRLRVVERPH
jgi:O-antigen/teichoic acid export membrane protein